jgi:hypothetical protein
MDQIFEIAQFNASGDVLEGVVSIPQAAPVVAPVDVEVDIPLSVDEDTFALAVIEYGGNLRAAWIAAFGEHSTPTAKAREMLAIPRIAKRVQALTVAIADSSLISLGSHMLELANIRDMAKFNGQLKVALEAEKSRGTVAGFYAGKESAKAGSDNPMVVVIGSQVDMRI